MNLFGGRGGREGGREGRREGGSGSLQSRDPERV